MLEFNFKPFPTLLTDRLILREITKKDVETLFLLRSNKEAMRFIDKPIAQNKEEIKAFIKLIRNNIKANESICWGIALKENEELIGTISFHKTDKDNHRAEIGYMLIPEQWNKGLISEAIAVVINYGFESMKLHSIEANINPKNTISRKTLEKFNFKKEAYFKENYFYNGQFLDTEILSLLRE